MILYLDEPAATDVRLAGGKAASLARLTAAGFPVPEGFIVTTTEETDLAACLEALKSRIESDAAFAVRSSGYLEDSAQSSFAGRYETVLGVRGLEKVAGAIARCFGSFAEGGAVIVQRLIEADAAGIAFTVEPVSGARDRIVIESNFGLGDSVVGGHVNPDGFTVMKATGEIAERRIGEKRFRSVLSSGGSVLEAMPEDFVRKASLGDQEVEAVAALAGRVETYFAVPVDIEWASKDGRIFLLQARPVTATG
jgi:pyruvate,water dikinase